MVVMLVAMLTMTQLALLEQFLLSIICSYSNRQSQHLNKLAHQAESYPGVLSVKELTVLFPMEEYVYSPLDGMLVHHSVTSHPHP